MLPTLHLGRVISIKVTMRAVQVVDWASAPQLTESKPPSLPSDQSTVQIRVIAVGLHQVVRSRASGKHYTSGSLPHTPGIDGVGVNTSTGKHVYFLTMGTASTGSFVELVNVPATHVFTLPDGVDPIQAAALMNPIMSSWMALKWRTGILQHGPVGGWTCLIVGALTVSGKLAIKTARTLGADKVIGAARNGGQLAQLDLDDRIILREPPRSSDFSAAASASVVLDYLYGPYPRAFLESTAARAKGAPPLTYVSIGSLAGADADIPSAALRSRDVTIRGAGAGSWDPQKLLGEVDAMLHVLEGIRLPEVQVVSVGDVERVWGKEAKPGERVVFVFDDTQEAK